MVLVVSGAQLLPTERLVTFGQLDWFLWFVFQYYRITSIFQYDKYTKSQTIMTLIKSVGINDFELKFFFSWVDV